MNRLRKQALFSFSKYRIKTRLYHFIIHNILIVNKERLREMDTDTEQDVAVIIMAAKRLNTVVININAKDVDFKNLPGLYCSRNPLFRAIKTVIKVFRIRFV